MPELGLETLAQIRQGVKDLVGIGTNPAKDRRIDSYINSWYARLSRSRDWPVLKKYDETGLVLLGDATKTIPSAQAFIPMPVGCSSPDRVVLKGQGYNDPLEIISPADLAMKAATTQTSHPPKWMAIVGETVQHKPLAADGALTVEGDAANDDLSMVTLYYTRHDSPIGQSIPEVLQGSFSTGVTTVDQAVAGWPVTRLSVSGKWVGALTIKDGSANVIARLMPPRTPSAGNPQSYAASRKLARVEPAPSADTEAIITWTATPAPLVLDGDVPEIPVAEALKLFAASMYYQFDRKFDEARALQADGYRALGEEGRVEDVESETAGPAYGNAVLGTGGWE